MRSASPSPQRVSTLRLRPSVQSDSRSPATNAATRACPSASSAGRFIRSDFCWLSIPSIVRHPIDTQSAQSSIADSGGRVMSITQFLDSCKFDPEAQRVMGVAFEMARAALQVGDQGNLINERIAKRIIELAKTGELNPDLLCEAVLQEFRQHL